MFYTICLSSAACVGRVEKFIDTLDPNLEEANNCGYCQGDHRLYLCRKFFPLTPAQKLKWVLSHGHCQVCLNKHDGKCPFQNGKVCRLCKSDKHHSELHVDAQDSPAGKTTPKKTPERRAARKVENPDSIIDGPKISKDHRR